MDVGDKTKEVVESQVEKTRRLKREAKKKYFQRTYDNAPEIPCKCGCGVLTKNVDKYARSVEYINGHNARKYSGEEATPWAVEKRYRDKARAENEEEYLNNNREKKNRYNRNRKIKAIIYKGNICVFCKVPYNGKNAAIFQFHHVDPSSKEALISKMFNKVSWGKTLEELDKCVLTCANCHFLHHLGEY